MCHTVRTALPCEPGSVRTARSWTRSTLEGLYPALDQTVGDDVALAVSELVTNCVRAEAHELVLSITAHADEIVVATTDDAPGVPRSSRPDDAVPRGRGLMIVDSLTSDWGVDAAPAGHKTVWGSFALDRPATTFDCKHRPR